MQLKATRMSAVCPALALAAALSSCAPAPRAPTGVARVLVAALQDADRIARVAVTVSRGSGPDFTPISADLTRSGDQFSGRLTGIPEGAGRRFDAVAYDASGAQLLSGWAASDIVASAPAVVTITLQDPGAGGFGNAFPVIDSLAASRDVVPASGTVQLGVSAHDPDGDVLSYGWTASCGAFDAASQPQPIWTAPPLLGPCQISVTVRDDHGATTTGTLVVTVVAAGDADVAVALNAWPVIAGLTGSVTLGDAMKGALAVVAADPDGDPLGYAWTSTCPGLVFDATPPYGRSLAQFTMPGPSAACDVTVTLSDGRGGATQGRLTLPPNVLSSASCAGVTCQSGQRCDPLDGACKPVDRCVGVTCPQPSDLCHLVGTCNASTGACDAQAPKCQAPQTCDLATGACVAADLCAGVTCPRPSDLCHVAGTCDASTGACSAETPRCAGQACDAATGQCAPPPAVPVPVPLVARDLQVSPPAGVAIDAGGNAYLAAGIFSTVPVLFDGHGVATTGDMDVFLAKYDPTGVNVWAIGYGDAAGSPQIATGAAVTADGTLAVIGSFTGAMTIGSTLSSAAQIDFLAGVSASTGAGLWARQLNDGYSGLLKAVAANPGDASAAHGDRIAVCGLASQAATDLVPGAAYGGQSDIVIAVYASSGARLWSRQIGTTSNEECDAVAIDDAGDVYAAGWFDGASLTIPGTPALAGPANSNRKFIWVAKLDGASGAGLSAVAFGNAIGQAAPTGLAADPAGKLVLAGKFTTALPLGGTTVTSAGGTDAFVAKLDPAAALAPIWAVRLGGASADVANGVATTSSGDVVVTGIFNKTTTGAAALTAAGTTSADVFLLELASADGATLFSAGYGDAVTQTGDGVAVNRFGANQFAVTGTLNGSIAFPAPAGALTATGSTDLFLVVGPIR